MKPRVKIGSNLAKIKGKTRRRAHDIAVLALGELGDVDEGGRCCSWQVAIWAIKYGRVKDE